MDEYISREAVLKAFRLTAKNSNKDYQRGLQDAIDCLVPEVIADIPSADVQPVAEYNKWINAKEQKPEAYEDVLVLFEYYFCGGNTTKLKIGTAYYVKDGDKWLGNDLYVLPNTNVIYWQPKTAESGG